MATLYQRYSGAVAGILPSGRRIRQRGMMLCARVVLLSYTLLILQPVIPIVLDNMAHTFWAKSHYRLVHQHNGRYHVHGELKRIVGESEKDKAAGKYKAQKEASPHIAVIGLRYHSVAVYVPGPLYPDYACHYPVAYHTLDYPPPEA